jgi:hypothetical protein
LRFLCHLNFYYKEITKNSSLLQVITPFSKKMWIVFCVLSPSTTPQLVGHVGSNKYRAVANLKFITDEWLRKNTPSTITSAPNTKLATSTQEWTEVPKESDINDKTPKGMYCVTENELSRVIYSIDDELDKGWLYNSSKKVIKKCAIFYLAESKFVNHVKIPDEKTPITYDDILRELTQVIASRGSK